MLLLLLQRHHLMSLSRPSHHQHHPPASLFSLPLADAPTCASDQDEVIGALKHETVVLKCEVDASPAPTAFHWTFHPIGEHNETPTRLQGNEVSGLARPPLGQGLNSRW